MWFCFNDGFLSVVTDKNNAERLMVRARRRQDLLNVLGDTVEIIETPGADYCWRAFVSRDTFKLVVSARIDDIDYTNFKNSVHDADLHDMYSDVWSIHRRYQQEDPSLRRGERGGGVSAPGGLEFRTKPENSN